MNTKKKILITGTSTGFGNITAKELALKGHTVYATMRDIHGKNQPHKDALLQWASANKADIKVLELDVTSDGSVQQAVNKVLAETGGQLDVVINNAGIYGGGLTESFTVQDYKHLFEVNVFGSARVTNAVLPTLRKQGHGLIIQLSSVLGRIIIPFGGVYDATKFALEAITESLHYELKPLGVDVSIVQPGPFATELVQKVYQPGNMQVVQEYGASATLMSGFFQNYTASMTDPNIPNKPLDVADAIVHLVETKNGSRPLRVVVDKMMGGTTEILNNTAEQIQAGVLQNFGLTVLI